jgi:formylglycine-generating enzyme required for sulfatase activity
MKILLSVLVALSALAAPVSASLDTLRINCGGGDVGAWISDRGCKAGVCLTSTAYIVWAQDVPQKVYQTCRSGPLLIYNFRDLPNGRYRITLRFCELVFSSTNTRMMRLKIEGFDLGWLVDVFFLAGGRNNPLTLPPYTAKVVDGNGLQIEFTGIYGAQAIVNGIEIVPFPLPAAATKNMTLVPAGFFSMGDKLGEGSSAERPVHTEYLSPYYLDRYEVTKGLWDQVYTWALTNGYAFDHVGFGKGASYPVHSISWFDAVKWCNARSEMRKRMPAYYTSEARTNVYRTGQLKIQNDWVRWDTGYRLPTEAEWERAARGGAAGKRFPWASSDQIQHARANYISDGASGYDTSPTRGHHPDYVSGTVYSSPVGSFAANGYGLYDMAGNAWEMCWDRWDPDYYAASPGADPRGPASGSYRLIRGGSWNSLAEDCRVAGRAYGGAAQTQSDLGFRTVLR